MIASLALAKAREDRIRLTAFLDQKRFPRGGRFCFLTRGVSNFFVCGSSSLFLYVLLI